jgi:hypothetical protein
MSRKKSGKAVETEPKTRFQRFVRRRPKMVLLGVNVLGFAVLLAIVEIALRIWGMQPGSLTSGWADFKPLPAGTALHVSNEFYTDVDTIYKANADSFVHREGYHINRDGFRGPDFLPNDSSRKKIMLIGDSFTWGATAKPIDSCYADRLRLPGYQVLNLGIPGTDPDQYARLARHYVPTLRPDIVCLFFYMANDVLHHRQDLLPFQNRYHVTNIGWLNPFLDGDYIGGPVETYAYYVERLHLPKTSLFNRICASTVIGTKFWEIAEGRGWIKSGRGPMLQARIDAFRRESKMPPISGQYLREVQAVCHQYHVPFRLFIIPTHNNLQPPNDANSAGLFQGIDYRFPGNLGSEDYYPKPDGHFNNKGHRKMAEFVMKEIETVLGPR